MSRTVCSWCKAPLVLKDDILVCSNTDCPACDEKYLHEELIRTRKALDVAVDALKKISLRYSEERNAPEGVWTIAAIDMAEYADNALDQITALEQKDK